MTIIAILETGRPPRKLVEPYGTYDTMFRRLLGDGFDYQSFAVFEQVWPGDPEQYDGILITGSPAGAYEDRPWIAPLEAYLAHAAGKRPMVGVCFGHQIMAQAFGGKVIKSPKGRAMGLQTYALADGVEIGGKTSVAAPASHGDQVVELAPHSKVLGGNDFCPFGIIDYPFRARSVQFHPEFEPDFAKALLTYEDGAADDPKVQAAERSLDAPNDDALIGGWMAEFLRG